MLRGKTGIAARKANQQDTIPAIGDQISLHFPTLLAALDSRADDDVNGITVLGERETDAPVHRSFKQIHHAARCMAAELANRGVRRGDRVMIVLPTCHEFVAVLFGLHQIGAVPVPVYPPAGRRFEAGMTRLAHVANHADIRLCITCKRVRPFIGALALRSSIRHIASVEELDGDEPLEVAYQPSTEDIAFIQYTSGSTGSPKGAVISQGAVVANIHSMGLATHATTDDVMVSWCPLYHDMGLVGGLLQAFYSGINTVLLPPTAFLAKPVRWLRAIQDYRGTMSAAPNFAYSLCVKRIKPQEREGLDLSSWRIALNGAEKVCASTIADFQRVFGEHGFRSQTMLPVYGLAEATVAVSFPRLGSSPRLDTVNPRELARGRAVPCDSDDALTVVCVGPSVPGQALAVNDADGRELPDRHIGHITVQGRSLMTGYFRDDEKTSAALRGGRLWTGDLGYIADGELFITGRAKDLLIVNGRNYYPEDVEIAAEDVEGVRKGCSAAFSIQASDSSKERVVLVCETRVTDAEQRAELIERIQDQVAEECEVPVHEIMLIAPGALPKTSSGKRQRSQCRALYLANDLHAPELGKLRMAWILTRSRVGLSKLAVTGWFSRPQHNDGLCAEAL